MSKYAFMFVLNLFSFYLFLFWYRLTYWLMEGYVPWVFMILSCLAVLSVPIAGNLMIASKARQAGWKVLLFFLISVACFALDPFLFPHYREWVNEYTMQLSFSILDFFKP